MHTHNHIVINADRATVYQVASDTAQWPTILPHYRYVNTLHNHADVRVVEMSANRDFGVFQFPTWWSSLQWNEPETYTVRYRHVGGITRGMDVEWRITSRPQGGVDVVIDHTLRKRNPLVALFYALIVGQVFVHFIAQRTLEGVKRHAEQVSVSNEQ